MESAKPVSQERMPQLAEYFSILGQPMRLQLLNLLRDGEKRVQELVEASETSQANVSKHLKLMLQAGILRCRRQGTSAYYSVEDDLIFELCSMVHQHLNLADQVEQYPYSTPNLSSLDSRK